MSQQSNVSKDVRDILPSKHASSSVPSLPHDRAHHLHRSPSFTSLAHSEGDVPFYTSALVQDPSAFDLPDQSDIIIAVMGPTGAGKSTFINKAAGIEETEVGHGLESCTHSVKVVRCLDTRQNRQVVFVDTPGFNDTNLSDLDILQLVANWLKVTYEKGIHLSGLLFFHRISDNRMGGSPMKYLRMFKNLCGDEALKKVVLVTTMWDEVEEDVGSNRETELFGKYWKPMLELGCHTSRFHNDTGSAWDIVSRFQGARCTVLLQKELVDLRLELAETSAGRTLFSLLIEFIRKIKEFLAEIEIKLKQGRYGTDVERSKIETEAILRDADAQRRRYSVSSSIFRRLSNSRPSTPVNFRRPATFSCTPTSDTSSNVASRSPVEAVPCASASVPLTSSPTIECLSPPPSPAEGTSKAYGGNTVLQGTITALKLVYQMVGLAPVPGLQSLVGLVLNITEVVNNMYTAEEALIELAQKAGSFMVTLVEQQESIINLSDCKAMKPVIEGLTKEMKRVLKVVVRISAQKTAKRLVLGPFDKAAIDECNRQMALACGLFGIQIAFISQQAIARIEAKLDMALKTHFIPPRSDQRAATC